MSRMYIQWCVDITSTSCMSSDWRHPLLGSSHHYDPPFFWSPWPFIHAVSSQRLRVRAPTVRVFTRVITVYKQAYRGPSNLSVWWFLSMTSLIIVTVINPAEVAYLQHIYKIRIYECKQTRPFISEPVMFASMTPLYIWKITGIPHKSTLTSMSRARGPYM